MRLKNQADDGNGALFGHGRMGRNPMDFRQLKYFAMVAEAKSFTRAAELLRLAQPALSNQMQKLEEDLQEQLLIRHSRGIELTDAGRRLLGHARTILHQLDLAREDVRGARDEPEGLVRVGMSRSVAEMLAVELIREAGRRAPAISIRIVEHFSETVHALLLERELDLALTYNPENSVRVAADLILLQRLSLISPASASFPASDQITFSEVMRLPLILGSPVHVVRKLVASTAADIGATPNVVHEIDSLQTVLNMVEGGLGHTVLPPGIVARAVQSGTIEARTIVSPELVRRLHLLRLAQSTPTRAQLVVRDILTELLQRQAHISPVAPVVEDHAY
jgi:LysR family transcriptional regulator, nitrogen assimilation regulatory protein